MRILILADIHANAVALKTVFDRAFYEKYDKIVVLGDLVGYNPYPNEAIEFIKKKNEEIMGVILGNHDNVILGTYSDDDFNPKAKKAVNWTKEQVSEENFKWLQQFHDYILYPELKMAICHGSIIDPNEYLTMIFQAKNCFREMIDKGVKLCFNGHTHVPIIFSFNGKLVEKTPLQKDSFSMELLPYNYYIINPGSVGQPRDGNSKSAFAIYDTLTRIITFYRVKYDVKQVQEDITKSDLPPELGIRLGEGY